jgi:neutral ceramidase
VITRRDFLASTVAVTGFPVGRMRDAAGRWQAGAAADEITPPAGLWMAGYAARREPAQGVALPLRAKALAIRQGDRPLVLVTVDLLGVTAAMRDRISRTLVHRHGLGPEAWMLAASHTHCGPVVDDQLSVAYDLDPAQRDAIAAYTARAEQTIATIVGEALSTLAPAQLVWGEGRARFGANRRSAFLPPGPADPAVPILRVDRRDGTPLAVVFGYACHNTTLPATMVHYHGDYAGVAQREIERRSPGVQAMFVAGCGADVNPSPRGTLDLAEQHGIALADAVAAVRDSLTPVAGPLAAGLSLVDLPFATPPTRDDWLARQKSDDVYVRRHASLMLQRLDRDGQLESFHREPVQVWQLGQLTLIALGGEVVTDYVLRLKREHASDALWVAAYCNDVSCYIPSFRVLDEGGYEGGGAMLYYGRPGPFDPSVEDRIVTSAARLIRHIGGS